MTLCYVESKMVSCALLIWRRGSLHSSRGFQRLNASFLIPRRYLTRGRPLNESEDAERNKFDIRFQWRNRGWTSEEEKVIDRAIEGGLLYQQCEELLPTRTSHAIRRKYNSQKRILRTQSGGQIQDEPSELVKLVTKLASSGLTASQMREGHPHLSLDKIHTIANYHAIKIQRSTRVHGSR